MLKLTLSYVAAAAFVAPRVDDIVFDNTQQGIYGTGEEYDRNEAVLCVVAGLSTLALTILHSDSAGVFRYGHAGQSLGRSLSLLTPTPVAGSS